MMTASTPPSTPDAAIGSGPVSSGARERSWLSYLPAYAGVGYLVAWIAGLAAWPSNLALNATSAQVTASYRTHSGPAAVQYLLVEGLAGLLLGVVLGFVVLSSRASSVRASSVRASRFLPVAVLGAAAVAISLAQCVLGLVLIAAASRQDVSRAGELSTLVSRLDGLKMLALAGVAAYLAVRAVTGRLTPRWLRAVAALTALALLASGCTYLLLANALAWTVYISGPLLLIWITGTGIRLTRS
jgi:hypothetical protein